MNNDPTGLVESIERGFRRHHGPDPKGEYGCGCPADLPGPDMTPAAFNTAVESARPGVLAPWVVSGVAGGKPPAAVRYAATVLPLGGGKIPVTAADLRGLLLEVLRVTARQDLVRADVGKAGR